jgi:hypothetical protein
MLVQMGFPVMVLLVFGMVSIAFVMQMPKEKPMHNVRRVNITQTPQPFPRVI